MLLAILLFLCFLLALGLVFVVAFVGGLVKTLSETFGEMRREFLGGRR